MPCCAVLTCKNESRNKNVSCGGVSYHRFPKDPFIKEKWIDATGRQNWMPTKSSAICSEHFEDQDVQISKKGYRYLNDKAIPTKNILIFKDYNNSERNEPGPSRKPLQGSPPLTNPIIRTDVTPTKKARQAINSELTNSPTDSTPRKRIKQLQWTQSKLNKQNLKVKRLQSRNLRLNKKNKNMEELLKSLKKNYAMKSEELDSLKNTNVKMPLTNAERQKKYREKLRTQNPSKYEEMKSKNAVRNKKRKKITEFSEKDIKVIRKQWKVSQYRRRMKLKGSAINDNTTDDNGAGTHKNTFSVRRLQRKLASQEYHYEEKFNKMKYEIHSLKKKCKRYVQKTKKNITLVDELKLKPPAPQIIQDGERHR